MNVNDYTVMNSQYYQLTDKVDDYKKNYDLIESIMELERDLMSPESSQADTSIQDEQQFQEILISNCIQHENISNSNTLKATDNTYITSSKTSPNKSNKPYLNKFYLSVDSSSYPYDLEGITVPDETTKQIANKIKEFLIENKISQKNLAENLLNMKQANLSPILSNPKPWDNLTPVIRNRFLVMHMWLNDENRIEKLANAAVKI